MEDLLKKMAETNQDLDILDKQHKILEKELEYFQNHGLFDLDKKRPLKNKEAEAIIVAWEEKTGQTIDRRDPAAYETILNILMEIEEQRIQLRHDLDGYTAEYDYRKKQLDKAIKIRDDLQNGNLSKVNLRC